MADQQFDVSAEDRRLFEEKQKQRSSLRQYYLKNIHNPHRHATEEGGFLFDPALFRYQAMNAKHYAQFRPTIKNGILAFCLLGIPILGYGYLVTNERETKENAFRSGQVAYRDRDFKLI